MARFTKKRPLLLIILMLVCTVTLINCGQGSSSNVSSPTPAPKPTPTPQPTVCASCITMGEPSLKKLGESSDGLHYLLSFVITNNGDGALSKFVVDIKEEAQTATTNQSNSETSTSSTSIPGHSQFTYQVGDPNVTTSGITLPNPPPSSIHVTVTLTLNGTPLAHWDGQVNVPLGKRHAPQAHDVPDMSYPELLECPFQKRGEGRQPLTGCEVSPQKLFFSSFLAGRRPASKRREGEATASLS